MRQGKLLKNMQLTPGNLVAFKFAGLSQESTQVANKARRGAWRQDNTAGLKQEGGAPSENSLNMARQIELGAHALRSAIRSRAQVAVSESIGSFERA